MTKKKCRSCDGTGKVKLLKSWFPADGFRAVTCWMCDGSGHSDEPDVFQGWRYEKSLAAVRARHAQTSDDDGY